jgi:hypothetical protein
MRVGEPRHRIRAPGLGEIDAEERHLDSLAQRGQVDDGNVVTACGERPDEVAPDVAGAAGHEDRHPFSLRRAAEPRLDEMKQSESTEALVALEDAVPDALFASVEGLDVPLWPMFR